MKKFLSSILLATVFSTATLPLTGCTPSGVEADVNAVLNGAQNIVAQVDPSAPWLPQFKSAVAEVKTAEATWVAGGAKQDVINALNILAQVTALIPLTAQYSSLVDVLVAGIDVVLTMFGAAPPTAAVGAVVNPHEGRVKLKHRPFGNRAAEFKRQWNDTATKTGLHDAVVQ